MKTDEVADRHILSIPELQKLEFALGIDASQIWVDQFSRQVNKLKGGQAKAELVAVIATGNHAEVNWADAESVLAENPYLN